MIMRKAQMPVRPVIALVPAKRRLIYSCSIEPPQYPKSVAALFFDS